MLELVTSLDYSNYDKKIGLIKDRGERDSKIEKIVCLIELLLGNNSEPMIWQDMSVLETYMGPWESYKRLVEKSEAAFEGKEALYRRYTDRLIYISTYFAPEIFCEMNGSLREISSSFTEADRLSWFSPSLDILFDATHRLVAAIEELYDPSYESNIPTPLQQILLFNVTDWKIASFLEFTQQKYPDAPASRMCHACAYQALMPPVLITEWLDLLRMAGLDLMKYGERELKIWKREGCLPSTQYKEGSCRIQLHENNVLGLVKAFYKVHSPVDSERRYEDKIGEFERRVTFHFDPSQGFKLTWEDSWLKDELGVDACFCEEEEEGDNTREAERTHWAELAEHRKTMAMIALQEQLQRLPGAWKVEEEEKLP